MLAEEVVFADAFEAVFLLIATLVAKCEHDVAVGVEERPVLSERSRSEQRRVVTLNLRN